MFEFGSSFWVNLNYHYFLSQFFSKYFFSSTLSQWAWTAFGWIWNEPREWLSLQCRTLLSLLENTINEIFHLALFEKIQFSCFLKLWRHYFMTKSHVLLLPKQCMWLKLSEKAHKRRKIVKRAKKVFGKKNWKSHFFFQTVTHPSPAGLDAAATLSNCH